MLFTTLASSTAATATVAGPRLQADRRPRRTRGLRHRGHVVAQAPEHEVENAKLLAKAGDDPKKRRKVVRRKPPEGFVSWGRNTAERLETSQPEQLAPQFTVTPAMVLNVIARPGDAFATMRELIMGNHTPPEQRRRQARDAIRAYRALLAAGVVERLDVPDEQGSTVRLTADLPLNFALNQPLSTFALAAARPAGPRIATPTPSTSCRCSRRRWRTRGRYSPRSSARRAARPWPP